jgi:hypothetical protein
MSLEDANSLTKNASILLAERLAYNSCQDNRMDEQIEVVSLLEL